jgi:hypothetical protein
MSASPVATPHADGLDALGYEAADPALHTPLWSEAIQASPATRNLR